MALTNWFTLDTGEFALAVVNTSAPGYVSTWQTPGGSSISAVPISAYNMPAGSSWQCQITNGVVTPKKNTKRRTRPATWCDDESETSTPVSSSFTLDVEAAQDPNLKDGLTAFLLENDAKEAYFLIGLKGSPQPPRVAGRVYLHAGAVGGKSDDDLMFKLSLDLSRKPDAWFGVTGNSKIVLGG